MTKQRLSKLQRIIIKVISDEKNTCYCHDLDMLRYVVEKKVFGEMAKYVGGVKEKDKRIFEVSFCNSIRNLKKKDLVRFTWKSNTSRKSRIKNIYLTEDGLKLITVINNKNVEELK